MAASLALLVGACGDGKTQKAPSPTPAPSMAAPTTTESDNGAVEAAPLPAPPGLPRPRGAFADDPEASIQIATSSCGGRASSWGDQCPLYVMSVERTGAVHFRGTTYVRVEDAKMRLPADETRALFALVSDAIWGPSTEGSALSQRLAPPVRFAFRFAGGPREIEGDPRCSQDGSNTDRFTLPTPLCELEHALRKVAQPFTECDTKVCPRTPDPKAKPKERPPPVTSGLGRLEVHCPSCRSISVVVGHAQKKLGKSPARIDLPPGTYTVELTHAKMRAFHYPTVRAGETATVRSYE